MVSLNTPFWGPRDEAEYIRQEQQRIKKMRDAAFTLGFDAGAAWGISRGVQEMARIFGVTADSQKEFPPELVRAFAASITENASEIEKVIIDGMKRVRAEATAAAR